MITELIARVFCTRDCAHLKHWSTGSYAEHQALGDFYEEVIDIVDNLVECYQGNFGRIGKVKLDSQAGEPLKCMESDAVWIAENSEAISGDVEALENILQELTGLYLRTIYKLKFLK